MTFHFIHFTIQEFLAAHYIAHLPPNVEQKLIEANFWNNIYFNMFSIYVSFTKGQRSPFKAFLSGGNEEIAIADKFLQDRLKCLHLYHCFNEADDHTMCYTIEQAEIFKNKEINLWDTTFTAYDMECLSVFLTSSFNKEWKELNLYNCHIQNKGLNILCRGLCHSGDIAINKLWLDYNGLTARSSSLISELTVKCKIKILRISDNCTIGEDQQLYSMLTHPCSMLELLYMYDTRLSSRGAAALFTSLKDNNRLKVLYVNSNNITDDACDAITAALKKNGCLEKLRMYQNPLSSEIILNIVRCLEVNNTLQYLGLPNCQQGIQENIQSLQEVINKKRESRGCQLKLKIKFNCV